MKKLLLSTITAMALSTSAYSAIGIDLEAGGGVWKPSLSGDLSYSSAFALGTKMQLNNLEKSGSTSSNNYFYADLSHFIPIIPNARIESLEYSISGIPGISLDAFGMSTNVINFAGVMFDAASTLKMNLNIKQNDYIVYWEFPFISALSSNILNVNYGLDAKNFKGSITATGTVLGKITEKTESFDVFIPLVYIYAQVDLPTIPLSISATVKTLAYEDSKISDNQIKISYKLPIPKSFVDFSLDLGYRVQNITVAPKLVDNLDAVLDTKGVFFGLNAKF